jgi:D-serine deaminase-like pyridoxal phosphate-dependent protein
LFSTPEKIVIGTASLDTLETPSLILDKEKMERNALALRERLKRFQVGFRPHFKTPKNIDVFRRMVGAHSGAATVSTLKEAEYLFAHGITDILYAVGVAPNKLDHVFDLRRRGANLSVILDNAEMAAQVAAKARAAADPLPVLLEIDSDGHRGGVSPADPELLRIGSILSEGGAHLAGVMTHAGGSYDVPGEAAITEAAERERHAVVTAAEKLRAAGLPCAIVSVGSTPTAHFARDLTCVTEVRPGTYIFFDLVMSGLGVCRDDEIAISVLATVIGHQNRRGWTIVDAGWMAMSRDRGTASQPVDQFYGTVCDLDGRPYPDLVMLQANQEHGIVALRPGAAQTAPTLPIGTRVRILPNHACATAAQHDRYLVVNGGREIEVVWPRLNGWTA